MQYLVDFLQKPINKTKVYPFLKCNQEEALMLRYLSEELLKGNDEVSCLGMIHALFAPKDSIEILRYLPLVKNLLELGWIAQHSFLKNLSQEVVLLELLNMTFSLSVSENTPHEFFGMTLYPSENSMEEVLAAILGDKVNTDKITECWNKTDTWHIEIDNKLFFDTNLNANPSEMVAVLLHEVGHVIGTNSIPLRLKNKFRDKLLKMNVETRARVQNNKFTPILFPVIIEACSTKMYRYVGRSNELAADRYAKDLGYGEELNSFLNKVIVTYGNKLTQVTEGEAEKDIDIMIDWSAEAIDELKYRKTKLKKSLVAQTLRTPCTYVKSVLNKIKNSFFGFNSTKDFDEQFGTLESSIFSAYDRVHIAQEMYEDGFKECEEIVREMFFSKKNNKLKKIDPLDLDYINIEIDKIVTDDDKIYLSSFSSKITLESFSKSFNRDDKIYA